MLNTAFNFDGFIVVYLIELNFKTLLFFLICFIFCPFVYFFIPFFNILDTHKIHSFKTKKKLVPQNLLLSKKTCFITLVRNSNLHRMIKFIQMVEKKINSKFKYDCIFFNDEPFI